MRLDPCYLALLESRNTGKNLRCFLILIMSLTMTHHVHILEMNGESFRLASSRKRQKDKEGRKMP